MTNSKVGGGLGCPAGTESWQAILAEAIRDPAELCRRLGLPAPVTQALGDFPMLVPRTYLARITPGDPHDPLLAQVLPREEELAPADGFLPDPLGEAATACATGLLRKYRGRLLILASGACGVHCRFCFRRHFPHDGWVWWGGCSEPDVLLSLRERHISRSERNTRQPGGARCARPTLPIEAFWADPSIDEIILSGGDPLTLGDEPLAELARQIASVPHVHRLRVHTRMPIVIPQRVTTELLGWLRGTRLTTLMVVHVNHPREIDASVAAALGRLVDAGIPVLSQTVLLRGVNDEAAVLAELCRRLVDLRVMPYYLHQLDRVAGAAHFEVPEQRGRELIEQLRLALPGYAVPRYVRETPGAECKQPLG